MQGESVASALSCCPTRASAMTWDSMMLPCTVAEPFFLCSYVTALNKEYLSLLSVKTFNFKALMPQLHSHFDLVQRF